MASKDEKTVVETTTSLGPTVSPEPSEKKPVDDVLKFAIESENITWTPEEEAKVVRKIDFIILPMLFTGAALSLADQQAFGFAALFGLIQDMKLFTLSLIGGQPVIDLSKYSLAAAMPALGAIAGQYPLLFLAQKFSYGKFLGIASVYTGLLALLTIIVHNEAGIYALRFFFGWSSIISPLAIIVTSMWWRTREQPLRVGIYIAGSASGNLIGQAVDIGAVSISSGPLASTSLDLQTLKTVISSWRYIYVILGSIAMLYGLIVVVLFPSSPMTAWFLTPRERAIAVRRLADNNTGIQTRVFKASQVREALLDPQTWLLAIYTFAFSFCNNALGAFGGFLVNSFGYSTKQAIILSMPVSAIAITAMVLSGVLGTRFFPRHRLIIAICFLIPTLIGNIILWKSPRSNIHALLGGLYLCGSFYGAFIQCFALLAGNVAGHTKKTVVNATIVVISNLGGFAGPYSYKQPEAAQGYPTGQISTLCLMIASIVSFASLYAYYTWRNGQKVTQQEQQRELAADPNLAFMDLTDQENPAFRYST